MEDYFKNLGLISSQSGQNGSWKDGIEFPAPNIQGLRKKKKAMMGHDKIHDKDQIKE